MVAGEFRDSCLLFCTGNRSALGSGPVLGFNAATVSLGQFCFHRLWIFHFILKTDLILNQAEFDAGYLFDFSFRLINSGGVDADMYVVLDVDGAYWFRPGWTQSIDSITGVLPAGVFEESFLDSSSCIRNHNFTGDIDSVEFGYD